MAGKPRNRLELRRQHEAAEDLDPIEADEPEEIADDVEAGDDAEKKPKKKKAPAKPKVKAVKAPKPAARMRIVWAVVNDAFKTVGTFEYAQKEAAEARAVELTAKGKGTHFVQKVKEPMPDNAPGLGAAIPRPVLEPVAVAAPKPVDEPADDEEEVEEDEDEEAEIEDEEE